MHIWLFLLVGFIIGFAFVSSMVAVNPSFFIKYFFIEIPSESEANIVSVLRNVDNMSVTHTNSYIISKNKHYKLDRCVLIFKFCPSTTTMSQMHDEIQRVIEKIEQNNVKIVNFWHT